MKKRFFQPVWKFEEIEHYLFKKVVWGIILFFLLFAPLVIGAVINIEKFLDDYNFFYMVY